MAWVEGMETLAARLASFDVAHPQPKRRGSNTKNSKALRWPHKTPSPEQLAKAGFFYKPTASFPDNAMCFLCRRSLDGWEEDDDPVTEHLKHSPHCGWAINVSIEQRSEQEIRSEEDPLNEKMMDARRETFADRWPHESKKGWTCKTEKMVEAGWFYCPTPESDDFVTCAYCNLSLDGWEPKDNPFEEHHRRSASCLFFLITAPRTTKPTKTTRAKKGRLSKASRRKMGSSFSKAFSRADISVHEGESVLSATPTATSAYDAPGARTRASTARKAESYMEAEDDDFTVKVPEKIARLPEGRKRTSDEIERDLAAALQGRQRGGDLSTRAPPPKRMGLRTASGLFRLQPVTITRRTESPPQDTEITDADRVQPPAAVTTKEPQSPVHEGLLGVTEEVETDEVIIPTVEATKEVVKETKPNAKAGKRKANPKTKVEAQPELAPALEPETNTTEKIATAEPVHELPTASPLTTQPALEPETNTTEKIATAEPVHELATASPATPQPKKATKAPKKAKEAATKPKNKRTATATTTTTTEPSSPPQPSKKPTASPSPQSSNAENHPPTKEPFDIMSVFSPPMSPHKRALLAAEYAQLSPPRNNTNTGARRPQPAHTWTPVDLETIFLLSPSAGNANKQSMVLTTSEKEMSVEEWIDFNSEEAYEKLCQDGERYVQAFEAEGLKALKAIEALECV